MGACAHVLEAVDRGQRDEEDVAEQGVVADDGGQEKRQEQGEEDDGRRGDAPVEQIDEEGREVLAVEGSTVRVVGKAPEAGKVARLKISKIPGSEVVLTQEITVRGEDIISGGQTIQLSIGISPAYANPQATWSIEDCDERGEKLNGTQNNASLSEDHKLTGLKMGYVKVTASATDGSGVKGSKIFEVSSNAPAPAGTSSIGGGESAASFSPAVPSEPSLVDANPNSYVMNLIKDNTNNFDLQNIMSHVPEAGGALTAIDYNTIIGKKALRLVNYQAGMGDFRVNINCNQGFPGIPVVFLMLYMDINMQLTGDAVNAILLGINTIGVTLPANIATAIRDKDFLGIVLKQQGL